MKIRRPLAALALMLACAPVPAPVVQQEPPRPTPAPAPAPAPPQKFVLSILSLNDLHGRIGALPAFGGYVEALRRAHGNRGAVIAVDAGDMFQGTIASNQTEGQSVIRAYNALGLSVATLGNHEFDYGPIDGAIAGDGLLPQAALRARIAEAKFPVLSANLQTTGGTAPVWPNLLPRALVRAEGIQVGFVGVLTQQTPSIVMPDYFAGLTVSALAPAIEAQAAALRAEGANVVVALAHAGGNCEKFDDPHDLSSCDTEDSELFSVVRAVRPGLVDAWIGGHTHAGVAHFVNGVPVVEALSRGKAFGRIDLELSGAPPSVLRARPFPPEPLCPETAELAPCPTHAYAGQNVEASPAVTAVIAPALDVCRNERDRLLGVEIGERLPADHDTESALGNLFVDLMRAQVPGADAALANGGSLRAPLDAGSLTYGALYDTMPFDNRLVTIELTGKELRTVLESHFAHDAHGIVSIAGVLAQARCERGQLQVKLRRSNGAPIADRERLSIVTSDYLATGGDRLLASIADSRARIRSASAMLLRDVLAEQLTKRNRRVSARDLYEPRNPRLTLPTPRPVHCAN